MQFNIKSIGITLLSVLSFTLASAQEKQPKVKTETFEVKGVCTMCKERIEKAALIKGVRLAEWSSEKQEIKVIFKTKLASLKEIHKAIAEVGHDTSELQAKEETYKQLPGCCLYRDGVEVH